MLPEWEVGTPAVLIVAGPHAIPVSTSIRRGDDRVVFALGRRRETLTRLRSEPGAALCVLGRGVAFTAYGRTEMLEGARYEWRDEEAVRSESRIRQELATI